VGQISIRGGFRLFPWRPITNRPQVTNLPHATLFLGGHLLFDVAPSADLQAAADPAKLLSGVGRGFSAANRTLGLHRDAICFDQAFGALDDLGCDDLFRGCRRFAFHLSLFNMSKAEDSVKPPTGVSNRASGSLSKV